MKKGRDLLRTIIPCSSFVSLPRPTLQMEEISERYSYDPILRWNPQVEDYFARAYGPHHFSCISKALTTGDVNFIDNVNLSKTDASCNFSTVMEENIFSNENNDSQSLHHCGKAASEQVGVTNMLKESFHSSPISKCQFPGLDYVLFVRGSGPHKIDYGYADGIPPKEILVSENVLRRFFVVLSAHVEKGDVVAVSVAVEQPSPDGGWGIGITRGTVVQGLQTGLESSVLHMELLWICVIEYSNSLLSMVWFSDPHKGERILDMCAAPGGKTTAIAILMKDEGEVVAVDRSHNKMLKAVQRRNESDDVTNLSYSKDSSGIQISNLMMEQVEKSGSVASGGLSADKALTISANEKTYLSKADTRKNVRRMRNGPGRNQCKGGKVENSKGFAPNSFDRVLLDAPCSALGLRPRLFSGEETIDSLRNHGKYQRRMFDQAVQLVRSGGVIVYSTCTINPGENEALVRYALDKYKFLSLAQQEWLRPGEEELVQRFDPSSELDTIGFS
ncbi:hypothetical protein FNV43_RR13246 [Rhamnella rubrinervis]|uniref:SAM-dependent MTase RsmB/NOP-type domain-containing protein n=1 Tax=Rhamnella rubrinervis TaxID=2594499 RepID=A0A8K0H0S6_9ROSA|nr:hypothetical protein FNV43_RR13246 [Rhamnella rubrinervis]